MILDSLSRDALIVLGLTAGVLGGGLLLMVILGIRGAGRKASLKTELNWPFGEEEASRPSDGGPEQEFPQ